jgi:hypothetical protein
VSNLVNAARERAGVRAGEAITRRGERIGLGDRVATRRNDRDLAVANRDTWTVTGIGADGSLHVTGRAGRRTLPAAYVREHIELAFTTTAYGAQGETVDTAHLALADTTGAASAYVGMTRGRHRNVAHLVAETIDDARSQWVDIFNRDRADLGPTHAAHRALTTSTGTDRTRNPPQHCRPRRCRPRRCATAHAAHPHRSPLPTGPPRDRPLTNLLHGE